MLIPLKESSSKNFGLTEEKFKILLEQLHSGNETLFEQVFLTHFGKCMALLKRKYGAAHEEAYDCCMWAMLRFRQILLDRQLEFGNLEAFFTRIAVTHLLKEKEKNAKVSFTDEVINDHPEDDELDPEMLPMLEKAWTKLCENCQTLLKGFYYDKIELKQLTIILQDSSEANTRKRKERCLRDLRVSFFNHFNS